MWPDDRPPKRRVVFVSREPRDPYRPGRGGSPYGGDRYPRDPYGGRPHGGSPFGQPPMRYLPGYERGSMGRQELVVTRGRFHFSSYEMEELKKAFGLILLIFALAMAGWRQPFYDGHYLLALKVLVIGMLASALALLTGFVGHELAHKFVAQRYGHWAEFRSNERGMMFGLLLALFLGFVFVAPGAVMIRGPVSRREEGHISAAGPLSNFVWALVALPLYYLVFDWHNDPQFAIQHTLFTIFWFFFWINIGLGTFNMIPVHPLDGSKIWAWSKQTYLAMIGFIVGMLWLTNGPLGLW